MLNEQFNLVVEGIIWKIYHDPCTNHFLIENRSEAPRTSLFHLITHEGELVSTWEPEEENWWFNTIIFNNLSVFLTVYENEDLPETSQLHQYNAKNGELITQIKNCTVSHLDEHAIHYFQQEKKHSIQLQNCLQHSINRPFNYVKESDYFETVRNFIEIQQKVSPIESIEYLEHKNCIIISYYLSNQEQNMVNYLLILDLEGTILYQDIIAKDKKGIGSDSFFIQNNQLFFTKHKTSFVCLNL